MVYSPLKRGKPYDAPQLPGAAATCQESTPPPAVFIPGWRSRNVQAAPVEENPGQRPVEDRADCSASGHVMQRAGRRRAQVFENVIESARPDQLAPAAVVV